MKFYLSIAIVLVIFHCISCTKPGDTSPSPPPGDSIPTTTTIPDFTVTNTWECTVDGVQYSGNIDTSYLFSGDQAYNNPDTIVTCTGTSNDKKSNIYFSLYANGAVPVHEKKSEISMVINSTSMQLIHESGDSVTSKLSYNVDSFRYDKAKASFSGTAYSDNHTVPHTITNGKLSFKFNKGDSEPKNFSLTTSQPASGFIYSAAIVSNTLILYGMAYDLFLTPISLRIRTGENIKPGTYTNKEGNVGFNFAGYQYFVADTSGNFTVTISSVNNGIVAGSFSGTDWNGYPISNGQFLCRIKNYQPATDSVNQWKINYITSNDELSLFGGNILKAQRLQKSGRNLLVIDGNSDYGTSAYKIQLSSKDPITTGDYNLYSEPQIDSFYFYSATHLISSVDEYFKTKQQTVITIDSINANGVVGHIIENESDNLLQPGIKSGSFKASF